MAPPPKLDRPLYERSRTDDAPAIIVAAGEPQTAQSADQASYSVPSTRVSRRTRPGAREPRYHRNRTRAPLPISDARHREVNIEAPPTGDPCALVVDRPQQSGHRH